MNCKKFVTFAIAAMTLSLAANAEVLDPAQAWNRAVTTPHMHKINGAAQAQPMLLQTWYADQQPASYIFQLANADGYVVVSADDAVAPVLGYSDNAYDAANMPDGLRYWLDEFSRQIQWARDNGMQYTAPQAAAKQAIAPLTKTKWNQDSPYNDLCPTYQGKRCVTGCVATAGAQVLKYYNWPDVGVGEVSFYSDGIKQTLSMDFSQITFDWDNMLDTYDSNATDVQKEAVAQLMQAVGYGAEMDYSPVESGALSITLAVSLANNFKYDKSMVMQLRNLYGINDWNDLIYDQLSNYGPLIYAGQSNDGGHCFVCDGYNSDGYFHFNWGWGGMSDGYFLLTALDPGSQGIGGSTSGYNFGQEVICNLCKAGAGDGQVVKNLVADSYEMPDEITIGQVFTVEIPILNYSIEPLNGVLGFKAVSSDGTVKYSDGASFTNFQPATGTEKWQARFNNLDNGTYTVTPAWYDSDAETWRAVRVPLSAPQSYTMTVSGKSATFEANGDCDLEFYDMKVTPLYANAKFGITGTIQNEGEDEAYQVILPFLLDGENPAAIGDKVLVDLLPGESMELNYLSEWQPISTNGKLSPGTYQLYFVNDNGDPIYEFGDVQVQDDGTTKVEFGQLYFPDGNDSAVDASHIVMEASIKCTEGYFADDITAYIFPNSSGQVYAVGSITSQPVFLSEGEEATLQFEGSLEGDAGESYFAAIYYDGDFVRSTIVTFTLGTTGISDVKIVDGNNSSYYSIDGKQMDGNTLAPGVYIKRDGQRVSKVVIQ